MRSFTFAALCGILCACTVRPSGDDGELGLNADFYPGCDSDGKRIIQVDMRVTNSSRQNVDILFPPDWGPYGGLEFLAFDKDKKPLTVGNHYHGMMLPVEDSDYSNLTWTLRPGRHVLFSINESIQEEYKNHADVRYVKLRYFPSLYSSVFSNKPDLWRGKAIESRLRKVRMIECTRNI